MEIAKCCKAKSTDFKYQIRINYKLNNSWKIQNRILIQYIKLANGRLKIIRINRQAIKINTYFKMSKMVLKEQSIKTTKYFQKYK